MQNGHNLGQNFLINSSIADFLVRSANIAPEDIVLEVGAGTGAVTKYLIEKTKNVTAVEIDSELIPKLYENLGLSFWGVLPLGGTTPESALSSRRMSGSVLTSDSGRAPLARMTDTPKIINSDILNFLDSWKETDYKVVGSIPYSITSPLIHKLLLRSNQPKLIALIVQYEVAKKICAKTPNASYLSNLVALYGKAKILKKISPASFKPAPKVTSAVVLIEKTAPSSFWGGAERQLQNQKLFSNLLHKGFKHPRKMLNKAFDKEVLIKAGINPNSRPQEVTIEQWVKLYALQTN